MKKIRALSDEELIGMYLNEKSQKAALALYERYEPYIKAQIQDMVLDNDGSLDILMEVEISIFENLPHYCQGQESFEDWIVRICRDSL